VPIGSIDRRVARTRSLLQQALFKLTAEKGYANVTVEDICREADVGRSTFYTHYSGKGALRKATIDEHIRSVRARGADCRSQQTAKRFSFSGPAFEHAHVTRQMHRALIGGKQRDMPDEIREWMTAQVHRELMGISGEGEDGVHLEIATRFVVGAFFEVVGWWLDLDTDFSPAEVDRMFQQLAFKGVEAAIRGPNRPANA
jgi:AcrR family transcriptional regulator